MKLYAMPAQVTMLWDAAAAISARIPLALSRQSTLPALESGLTSIRRLRKVLHSLDIQVSAEVRRIKAEEREREAA